MNAVCAYREVRRAGLAEGATPHRLTLMLFDGSLARIEAASELNGTGRRAARHRVLDRALAIVHELQGALREPDTDELAGRLHLLYSHVAEQLLEADRTGSNEPLARAAALLGMLREAWVGIDPDDAS